METKNPKDSLIILDPKVELTVIDRKLIGPTKVLIIDPFTTLKQQRLISPKEVIPEHNRKTPK